MGHNLAAILVKPLPKSFCSPMWHRPLAEVAVEHPAAGEMTMTTMRKTRISIDQEGKEDNYGKEIYPTKR